VGFHGPGRGDQPATRPERLRIGILAPSLGPDATAMRRGLRLALEDLGGQAAGLPLELVERADDGPWGTAARRAVELAYEEKVWAILGGADGHRVHLAELIAAKLWVPVLSPWAFDRSVDYANVPWVFRLPPDDGQQAAALLGSLGPGGDPLLVLHEREREAERGAERVHDAALRAGRPAPEPMPFDPLARPEDVAAAALRRGPAAILVWARPASGLPLLHALRRAGFAGPLLAPAVLARPEAASVPGLRVAAACDLRWRSGAARDFDARYRARFGGATSPLAALAYDGLVLLADALRRAGLNRVRLRDALAASESAGVCGRLSFDGLGGGRRAPLLLEAGPQGWRRVRAAAPAPPAPPRSDR